MLSLKKLTPILAVCLVLALCSSLTAANTYGVSKIGTTKGLQIGMGGLQLTTHADDPTDERLANGRIYYQTSVGLRAYISSGWVTIGATTATADVVYNTGAWSVTVDGADTAFTYTTGLNMVLNAAATGTQAVVLEINDNTGTAITDGILFVAGVSIVDAVDAQAANIDNAINVGPNIILGTTAVINFTDFDVGATVKS